MKHQHYLAAIAALTAALAAMPLYADTPKTEADKMADVLRRMAPVSDEEMGQIQGRSRHFSGSGVQQIHADRILREIEVDNQELYSDSRADQIRHAGINGRRVERNIRVTTGEDRPAQR